MLIGAWSNFLGASQQLDALRLPEGLGVDARNMRLGFSDLRPWNRPGTVVTTGGSTPLISLYRMNRAVVSDTSEWLQWTTDVDVVRTLISTDPTEEIFYTGSGAPKSTDNVIGLPAAPGPASARTMGIPAPPTRMTVAIATAGTGTTETRVYVDTFVNDKGRESAPGLSRTLNAVKNDATVDISDLSAIPSGNHGITLRRIYVSIDGGDFLRCLEIIATATTATDTGDRGSVLQTGGDTSKPAWLEPPSNLKGLIALHGSMVGGFFGKTAAVCVPGKPWAWPVEYQETLHDDIVATAHWRSNWLILTTSSPVILRGGPTLWDKEPLPLEQPCRSKRSTVSFQHGACWAGSDGLCYAGDNGAGVITKGLLSKEQWEALNPDTMLGTRIEGYYVGFYDDGTPGAFMIDPLAPQGLVFLSAAAQGAYYDGFSGRTYLQDTGNVIKRWGSGTALTATFKTGIKRTPYPCNAGWAMVVADDPQSVEFTLWAELLQTDGSRVWTEIYSATVTSGEPFALPGDYLSDKFQVQVRTTLPVQGVLLGEEIDDVVT